MQVTSPQQKQIAMAYQVSPSAICRLRKTVAPEIVADPERLFEHLIEHGRKSPLRNRLANPVFRGLVTEALDLQAVRGTIPTAAEKISSII